MLTRPDAAKWKKFVKKFDTFLETSGTQCSLARTDRKFCVASEWKRGHHCWKFSSPSRAFSFKSWVCGINKSVVGICFLYNALYKVPLTNSNSSIYAPRQHIAHRYVNYNTFKRKMYILQTTYHHYIFKKLSIL